MREEGRNISLMLHAPEVLLMLLFFRDAVGGVRAVSRADFKALVGAGSVDAGTTVFDATIQFIGDLRRGGFETTFGKSWHSAAFSPPPPAR